MIWLATLLLQIPLPNAVVTFSPGGPAITNAMGLYSMQLDSPWSGSITTTYPGCRCLPMQILGTGVITNSQVVGFLCQDIQAPKIAITFPANNSTITKIVTLKVAASDNTGVTQVDWSLDGALLATVFSAPFSLTRTFSKKNGWRTVSAKAFDRAGNSATSSVRVRIQ